MNEIKTPPQRWRKIVINMKARERTTQAEVTPGVYPTTKKTLKKK